MVGKAVMSASVTNTRIILLAINMILGLGSFAASPKIVFQKLVLTPMHYDFPSHLT
jgi:hypothetical protein